MDENTNLILANAVKAENWEDCEKVTDDVKVLREEFRKRLYAGWAHQVGSQSDQPEVS